MLKGGLQNNQSKHCEEVHKGDQCNGFSLCRSRKIYKQLSAYAYHLSMILFHASEKYDDILRLNHLGVCMPPQSAVNLQRQMGENFNAKVLI